MPPAEDDGPITRLLVIKSLPLFADVPAEELAAIAEHLQHRTFAAGEPIYGGDAAAIDAIHLVLEGQITEHRSGRPFRTYGAQRVVGGVDALARSGPEVRAVADEDTRTLAIDRSALRDILEDNFGLLSAALQGVAAATLRLRAVLPAAGFDGASDGRDVRPAFVDSLPARMRALRADTWLGRAGIRALGQLAREADVTVARAGARLWSVGDTAEHAVVVLRGAVACTTLERPPFQVGAGTILGLEDALALEPRWHAAIASREATLLTITRTTLVDALEDDADTAVEVLAAMAGIASTLRDRVAEGAPA